MRKIYYMNQMEDKGRQIMTDRIVAQKSITTDQSHWVASRVLRNGTEMVTRDSGLLNYILVTKT